MTGDQLYDLTKRHTQESRNPFEAYVCGRFMARVMFLQDRLKKEGGSC